MHLGKRTGEKVSAEEPTVRLKNKKHGFVSLKMEIRTGEKL